MVLKIMRTLLTLVTALSVTAFSTVTADNPLHQPRDARGEGQSFVGSSSQSEGFKLLTLDGHFLLIGARNAVYNISLRSFAAEKTIEWEPANEDINVCQMKGNTQEKCGNYIRVLAKESAGRIVVCGTNAFRPLCRLYGLSDGEYAVEAEEEGNGLCPYDPDHNSTAFLDPVTGDLYAGTVADFAGKDPLIHRRRVFADQQDLGLRTERNDVKTLASPSFVGSIRLGGETLFWFREAAEEARVCGGAALRSRVARVCNADQGGPRLHADAWTSFLKARLNCSLPGTAPFYFDEIEAISSVVQGIYDDAEPVNLVYAVFNTPYSTIRGSAVCAFKLSDVRRIFAESAFSSQAGPDAAWRPLHPSQVPKPRPSTCTSASRQMSDEAVNFMVQNPLMDDAVPNAFPVPVFTLTSIQDRLTQIAVAPQVSLVDGRKVDVLYMGTAGGLIIKSLNIPDASDSVVIDAFQLFEEGEAIRNLVVSKVGGLIAVSSREVRRVSLARCNRANNCAACVALRDPHCAWHSGNSVCLGRTRGAWPEAAFLQDVDTGHAACPSLDFVVHEPEDDLDDVPPPRVHHSNAQREAEAFPHCDCDKPSRSNSSPKALPDISGVNREPAAEVVAARSLAIAILVTLVTSLLIGFIAGYQCSARGCLRRRKDVVRTPSSLSQAPATLSTGSSSQGSSVARSASLNGGATIRAYEPSPRPPLPLSTFQPNLGQNGPPLSLAPSKAPEPSPFATLPRDYRVKKIYL